jgi:REP element-mobilizing transposase RayT
MTRQARQSSPTGVYHIVLRGINRQRIFEDSTDYQYFLEGLIRALGKSAATVFAYCLMCNHVHLLIKEGNEAISVTMKRVTVRYASLRSLGEPDTTQLSDDRAWQVLSAIAGIARASDFQALLREQQKAAIQALDAHPISIRQIARLTGLTRKQVTQWRASNG